MQSRESALLINKNYRRFSWFVCLVKGYTKFVIHEVSYKVEKRLSHQISTRRALEIPQIEMAKGKQACKNQVKEPSQWILVAPGKKKSLYYIWLSYSWCCIIN